jgi:hypothetical protein
MEGGGEGLIPIGTKSGDRGLPGPLRRPGPDVGGVTAMKPRRW